MSGFSVNFYITAACTAAFVSFSDGMAMNTLIKFDVGFDFIAVAFSICVVFGLLALICIRQAIRTSRRGKSASADELLLVQGFRCPNCDSTGILQLPANAVSPFASYECGECGMGLIKASTKLVYLATAVLVIGAILFMALFAGEHLVACIRFGWIGFVVLGFSVRQLTRRSLCRSDDYTESNHEAGSPFRDP